MKVRMLVTTELQYVTLPQYAIVQVTNGLGKQLIKEGFAEPTELTTPLEETVREYSEEQHQDIVDTDADADADVDEVDNGVDNGGIITE